MTLNPAEPRRVARLGLKMGATAAAVALFLPVAGRCDTVIFNDGETVQGHFVAFHDGKLTFAANRFGNIAIEVEGVRELNLDSGVSMSTKSGESFIARALKVSPTGFQVDTRFGAAEVAWDDLIEIEPLQMPEKSSNGLPAVAPNSSSAAPSSARNQLTVSVSQIGNQLSGFTGISRSHLWSADVAYSRALDPSTTVSLTAPFFLHVMRLDGIDGPSTTRRAGIGDVSLTLSRRLPLPPTGPQVQLQVTAGLPTGPTDGPSDTTLLNLSSGNFSLGGQVNLGLPLGDGTALSALSYTRYRSRGSGDDMQDVGWFFGYSAPIGPSRSLMVTMSGSVQSHGNERSEPAYMGVRITQELGNSVSLQPSFTHGLNSDAQDYLVGISVSRAW